MHIVLLVYGGIPQDPEVFLKKEQPNARYQELILENDLDPEGPHDEDLEVR